MDRTPVRQRRLRDAKKRRRTARTWPAWIPAHPLLRVALITVVLAVLTCLFLVSAGVQILPDERYSWEDQARRMKAVNDRIEMLAARAPSLEEREALLGWSGEDPAPESLRWAEEVQGCVAEAQAVVEYTVKTEYHLSASRIDLDRELARFWRVMEQAYPEVDWQQVRRDAERQALRAR